MQCRNYTTTEKVCAAVRDWGGLAIYLAILATAVLAVCGGCEQASNATGTRTTKVQSHAYPRVPSTGIPCASCMLRAFRCLESSDNYAAIGDRGLAWGAYQFHRARWSECGGRADEWGRADCVAQDRVMSQALRKYMRAGLRRGLCGDELLWWTANYHNVGHGLVRPRRYATRFAALAREWCDHDEFEEWRGSGTQDDAYEDFQKF